MSSTADIVNEIDDKIVFLRKISKNDCKFLFNSLKEEKIIKYISIGPLKSLNHSKQLIKNYLNYWKKNKQFSYIIELNRNKKKTSIGMTNLWNINWLNKRAEIGIWLVSKHWGQGNAKRTINLLKIIAFKFLRLNRLEVHIAKKNSYSINLFKNCGFKQEGILKDYLYLRGIFHDAIILALINN